MAKVPHPFVANLMSPDAQELLAVGEDAAFDRFRRLNREIRRRTDVVGIFPNRDSIIRPVGAVPAEQHDEWAEHRRYLGLDALARARRLGQPATQPEEVPEPDYRALTA
jgi:hypothetical protein